MAFEMQDAIKNLRYGKNRGIKIKLGINTGPAIAAAIGYHKP